MAIGRGVVGLKGVDRWRCRHSATSARQHDNLHGCVKRHQSTGRPANVIRSCCQKYRKKCKLKIARDGSHWHCEGSNPGVALVARVDCLQSVQWNLVLRPPRKAFPPLLRSDVFRLEDAVHLRNSYNYCKLLAIVGTY